jgi:hypothetical protein
VRYDVAVRPADAVDPRHHGVGAVAGDVVPDELVRVGIGADDVGGPGASVEVEGAAAGRDGGVGRYRDGEEERRGDAGE